MTPGPGQYLIVWDERENRGRELPCGIRPEYGDYPVAVWEKERFWQEEEDYRKKTGKCLMLLPKEEFFAYFGRTLPKITKAENFISKLERLKGDLDTIYNYGSCAYSLDELGKEIEYMIEDFQRLNLGSQSSIWIPLEEKKPRQGHFVLMKNDDGFIAYACRRCYNGKEIYYIREGQYFVNPTAWTTKDKLLSH